MGFIFTILFITISLFSPGILPRAIVEIHVERVLMAGALLGTMFTLVQTKRPRMPEGYLLLGFLIAVCFSNIANGWSGGALNALTLFLPSAAIFYIVVLNCHSIKRLKRLTNVLVVICLVIIGCIISTYVDGTTTGPYVSSQQIGDTVVQRYHGMGFLSDPNDTAQLFVAVLPLVFLGWSRRRLAGKLAFALFPAILLITGVLMTHSRGATVAICAVILFGLRGKLGTIKSFLLTAIGAVILIALDISAGRGMTHDDGGRLSMWSTGLALFKSAPIFGIGFSRFSDFSDTGMTAHNSFVLCLSELGFFGYVFWIGLLVFTLSGLHWIAKNTQDEPSQNGHEVEGSGSPAVQDEIESRPDAPRDVREFAAVIETSLVGFLSAAFFLSRTYTLTLYLLLGMATSVIVIDRRVRGVKPKTRALVGRTLTAALASALTLYIIVRLHWAL